MKTIYKYKLSAETEQLIKVPVNAMALSVINQENNLMVYLMVESEEERMISRAVLIYGTGHPIKTIDHTDYLYGYKFLGTVPMYDASLIWHVWISNDQFHWE